MTKTDALVIRPLAAADEVAWRGLWSGYLAFYQMVLPEAVYRTGFDRMMSGAKGEYRGLIALWQARPVGLAHYLFHRTCWKVSDTCYLQDLWAEPDMRGKGVGRALIEAVYAAADAAGVGTVYWLTKDSNADARRLYDRIGSKTPFVEYDRP